MTKPFDRVSLPLLAGLSLLGFTVAVTRGGTAPPPVIPDPARDIALSTGKGQRTLVLAGGCFWGVEGVFEHVRGVSDVVSGYAGGSAESARYETVGTGRTGHAESVRITYDPAAISYGQLLKIFFSVAHDPTQLNRQGPDIGPQYRSAIFFSDPESERIARAYIDQLNKARVFSRGLATELAPLREFYPAEGYHQNFIARHPEHPYVVAHDLPKIERLRREFPALYR